MSSANFTAKRGTAIHEISLIADNPEQIEGHINGQQFVIMCKFDKNA